MKSKTYWRWALGALLVLAFGAGCNSSGCGLEPLPDGNEVPKAQTIEGGLQTRITPSGFQKLSEVIPGLVEQALGNGITVIQESHNSWGSSTAKLDFWMCPGGCNVLVAIPPGGINVTSDGQKLLVDLTLQLQFTLNFRVKVEIIGVDIADVTCGVQIDSWQDPLHFTVGIEPYIRDSDGELRLRLVQISDLHLAGITFSIVNCGLVGDFLNTFMDYINQIFDWLDAILGNAISEWIVNQWILPQMQGLVDSMLPDPLGIEGQLDVGSLLSSFSPGAEGILELRMVPGGYVNLLGNGMSLGVITGVNSDYDPTTRTDSWVGDPSYKVKAYAEGSPKMPPMATIDLAQQGLPQHATRGTYTMAAANELNGVQDSVNLDYRDPNSPHLGETADLGLGITEGFLNLFGFHLLNSGTLCLEIGTSEVSMLTVGLFSIMVSSLGDLVDPAVGDAPMRLVLRPQTLKIGNPLDENNPTPLLDLYLQDFRIDVYAFSEGRYVRAFTMALDMHIGLNLFSEVVNDTVYIKPEIEDIHSSDVTVRIHNSELISDPPGDLEVLFPSVLSMLMPMLTGALPDIALPELYGIKMSDLEFRPNDSQNILLILASLATPSQNPSPAPMLPLRTDARLDRVYVPSPEALRASLLDPSVPAAEKDVPEVRIAVQPESLPPGTQAEWQYRLNGGAWHGFRRGPELVLRDPTFYFQGWHHIEVRGRIKGYPATLERTPQAFDVLIDSVPPLQKARVADGRLYFGGFDYVTARTDLEYSYEIEPGHFSTWSRRASLDQGYALSLARAHGGVLRVRARDEAGNVSEAEVGEEQLALAQVEPSAKSGGGCAAGGSPSGLPLLLLGVLVLLGWRRRRPFDRGALVGAALVGAALLLGSAGCAKHSPGNQPDAGIPPCTDDDECAALQCEQGQLPLCIAGHCECMNDLVMGKVGPFSSHAESYDTIMVASYNQRYGDLMFSSIRKSDIASNPIIDPDSWEFVDGVPWDAEPDVPTSDIRGGIKDKGDDVGRYTSIAADASGEPVIAYYDLTHGALKLARRTGGNWSITLVDDAGDPESGDSGDAGRYAKLSMRPSDRAPGIAYFVQHLPGSDSLHSKTEIRFAQATSAEPTGPADWEIFTIDSLEFEVPTDPDTGDPLPLDKWPLSDWPVGVGVTCSVDHTPDGLPVVVYYDSANGNLKGARFNGTSFDPPVILDGENDQGEDTGNVGLFPSVKVDQTDETGTTWHVSYMDVGLRQLLYLAAGTGAEPELVDGGLRQEVNDITGLPMPVEHMVGFDSQLVVAGQKIFIAYQDGTTHELRWAERDATNPDNPWSSQALAGDEPAVVDQDGNIKFEGAFGFYIHVSAGQSNMAYISTYAINEWAVSDLLGNPPLRYWVQIFAVQLAEG